MSRITPTAKALQQLCDDAVAGRAPSVVEPEGPFADSFEQELYDLLLTLRTENGAYSANELAPGSPAGSIKKQLRWLVAYIFGNMPPEALNVTVVGSPQVGQTLSVTYTYADAEGDVETPPTYRWETADANGFNGQSVGFLPTYTVKTSDVGRYIRVRVMPQAATGATGVGEYQSAYTTVVTAGTSARKQFLGFGDSLTKGYYAATPALCWVGLIGLGLPISWAPFANLGKPGETAAQAMSRLSAIQAALDTTATDIYVSIYYGANDLTNPDVAPFIQNLRTLHQAVRALDPRIKTVAIPVMNRTDEYALNQNPNFAASRNAANQQILANSPKIADYIVSLAAQPLLAADGAPNSLVYYTDGVHLTDAGHRTFANTVGPQLASIAGFSFATFPALAFNSNFITWTPDAVGATFDATTHTASVDGSAGDWNQGFRSQTFAAPTGTQRIRIDLGELNQNIGGGLVLGIGAPRTNAATPRYQGLANGLFIDENNFAKIFNGGTQNSIGNAYGKRAYVDLLADRVEYWIADVQYSLLTLTNVSWPATLQLQLAMKNADAHCVGASINTLI